VSQRCDLFDERGAQCIRLHRHRLPSKVRAIGIRRMRADTHSELPRAFDRVRHRIGVAVVATAGDVRTGDQRPDLRFVRSAFAEVGTEIDHNSVPFVSGSSHTSTPPTAKKSAAQVMTTAKLYVLDAKPIANGAAADASRPPL